MTSSPQSKTPSAPPVRLRDELSTIVILLSAGALSSMTGGTVDPVFPDITQSLVMDDRWTGTVASLHILTTAIAGPIMGLLADRLGKKLILVSALIAYAVFGSMGGLAQNTEFYILSRLLVGVASGGIAAASIGWLATKYDGEVRSRILGYAASALASASIVFPLVGGWVGSFGWRWAFAIYILGIPVALVVTLGLRATSDGPNEALEQLPLLRKTLKQPDLWLTFAGLALSSACFAMVIVYAPLYFSETIGADSVLNGMILAARAIGAAILAAVGASKLARKVGVRRAIAIGFLIMSITLATIPTFRDPRLILFVALVFGLGFGAVMPNLYDTAAEQCPPETRATLLALGNGLSALGQFSSPFFLGPVWKYNGEAVFWVTAIVAGITGLILVTKPGRLTKNRL
ncbi:MAG: MFS transporter [Cyanobacteria bacterium P01_C01_bin.89]